MWRTLLIVLLATLSASAGARDIYKCTTAAGVAYQSTQCAGGQAETRLTVVPVAPGAEPVVATNYARSAAMPPTAAPRRPGPWRNRMPVLGISDDEVLNMPGWGRPSHIARTRTPREWQEVWTYASAAGERQLRFVNARLADVVDGPSRQVAQLTLQ